MDLSLAPTPAVGILSACLEEAGTRDSWYAWNDGTLALLNDQG